MAMDKITPTNLQGKLSAKISLDQLIIQQGRITQTPSDLSSLPRAIVLKGEVLAQNQDGTTRIQTSRGAVDVKLESPIPQGQKVDIQISSGSPPRDIIIQTAAPKIQPQTPAPQNNPQAPQAQTQAPVQTSSQTQPSVQPQAPTTQTQSPSQPQTPQQQVQTPPVEMGQTLPPNTAIEPVKNLQTTAQQVIETLQNPATAKPLQTGQIVRLAPLPTALQTPSGLAKLATLVQLPTIQNNALPVAGGETLNLLKAGLPVPKSAMTIPAIPLTATPSMTIPTPITSLLPQGGIVLNTSPTALIPSPTLALRNVVMMPQLSPSPLNLQTQATPSLLSPTPAVPASAQISTPTPTISPINTASLSLASPTLSVPRDAQILTLQTPVLATPTTALKNFTVSQIFAPTTPITATNIMPGQILAEVTGFMTEGGNPIIQVMSGSGAPTSFALNYPATNLVKGTQIVLQPSVPSSTAPSLPALNAWPQMAEMFDEVLSQLTPAQAQSLLNVIPRPAGAGFQFTAAALLFIAAANGGEISGWMGSRAQNLIQNSSDSKKDTINRLMSDIGKMTGRPASSDPQAPASAQGNDWRGYTLPALFGMDLSKIHMWTKPFGDDSNDNSPDKSRGTRFIVDLELSRMGNVQLDGLVQPYAKRLDLALKTEHDFAPNVRQHLRETWHSTLKSIDMTGQIDFQKA